MMKKILLIASLILSGGANAQWSELGGTNSLSANNSIYSVFNDTFGNLYAGGDFTNSNGKNYVAKWNGSIWGELGTGSNSLAANVGIHSICKGALGNIYAAGGFYNSSGKCYVAKWNGSSWSELGTGSNSIAANYHIDHICTDALGNIYAAGSFFNLNGKNYVAKWNGISWSELGGLGSNSLAANNEIYSICTDASNNIYASGYFYNSLGNKYVAKWNGTNWSELGTGNNSLLANNWIMSVCSDTADNIYAAGYFTNSSGKCYVAKWNGSSWSELGTSSNIFGVNGFINSICIDALGNIYAGGEFKNSSGKYYVAKWNGTNWIELGGNNSLQANQPIWTICIDAIGSVYAAGHFTNGSGKNYVAKYTQPLPLKLLSFTAQKENNNVLLNWQTANEVNVSHINIQRSTNNNEFTTIGKVNVGVSRYSFLDNKLPNTNDKLTLNYRLETVDKDGSKTYSEVKQIRLNELTNKPINIFPNPAKDFVTISCKGMKEVKIINSLGQEISRQEPRNDASIINTKQWGKGIYVVKVIMNNGEIKTEKLVVE